MNADNNSQPDLEDPRVIAALDEYVAALEEKFAPLGMRFIEGVAGNNLQYFRIDAPVN